MVLLPNRYYSGTPLSQTRLGQLKVNEVVFISGVFIIIENQQEEFLLSSTNVKDIPQTTITSQGPPMSQLQKLIHFHHYEFSHNHNPIRALHSLHIILPQTSDQCIYTILWCCPLAKLSPLPCASKKSVLKTCQPNVPYIHVHVCSNYPCTCNQRVFLTAM